MFQIKDSCYAQNFVRWTQKKFTLSETFEINKLEFIYQYVSKNFEEILKTVRDHLKSM